jgi:hypothetical protein
MTTFLASRSSSAVSTALTADTSPGRLRRRAGGRGRRTTAAEATGDHADEVAVHRAAHDVAEDRARRADQRAGDDQQVVAQHEAGGRRGPARVAVEHRHHHRHVGAADGHHHVHAEQQRDHRHHQQRQHAGLDVVRLQELAPNQMTTSSPPG